MTLSQRLWWESFEEQANKGSEDWAFRAHTCAALGRHSLRRWREIETELPEIARSSDLIIDNERLLRVYTDPKTLLREYDALRMMGVTVRPCSIGEVIQEDGVYANSRSKLIGGFVHHGGSVNARLFSKGLQKLLDDEYGVAFRWKTEAHALSVDTKLQKATGIQTSSGDIAGDQFLIAPGSRTDLLVKSVLDLRVEPIGGCTLTIPIVGTEQYPRKPVKYLTKDGIIVISPYIRGDNKLLRVGGLFYFAGHSADINSPHAQYVVSQLKAYTHELFPELYENSARLIGIGKKEAFGAWEGFRPMTPDGIPVIGQTRYSNVFVNTGHGTGGTVHAPGSADIVVAQMVGKCIDIPDVDTRAFDPNRFIGFESLEQRKDSYGGIQP